MAKADPQKKNAEEIVVPRKPMSEFFIFAQEYKKELLHKNPDMKTTEVISQAAEEWKKIPSTDPLKVRIHDQYKALKDEYDKEMTDFKKDPQNIAHLKKIKREKVERKTRRKKQVVDQDRPKRPMISYLRYMKDVRPEVIKENPGLNNKEIVKFISKKWTSLPESEKERYNEAYKKDMEKFNGEMEAYKKKKAGSAVPSKGVKSSDREEDENSEVDDDDESESESEESQPRKQRGKK